MKSTVYALLLSLFIFLVVTSCVVVISEPEALSKPEWVTAAFAPKLAPAFPFYGFIHGGVSGPEAFKDALGKDAALAKQFTGFDFSRAHTEVLEKTECDYIAYRRGDSFAWTKKCKLLPKGTRILTDGHYRIRGACGNLISNQPEVPTIPEPLEPTTLDVPEVTPAPSTTPVPVTITQEYPPAVPPSTGVPVLPPMQPPAQPPIVICCGSKPPVHAPDGDDWQSLFIISVSTFIFALWFKRKRELQ